MRIATVTPVYRSEFSAQEQVSIEALKNVLGDFDNLAVRPPDVQLPPGLFRERILAAKYFESLRAYSDLLLNPVFYETLSDYDYILIFQTDAFVFADELERWCLEGYDYLGAPWLRDEVTGECHQLRRLWRERADTGGSRPGMERLARRLVPFAVGNGGFSLRRVATAIQVLRSTARYDWRVHIAHSATEWRTRPSLRLLARALQGTLGFRNDVRSVAASFIQEDIFWSVAAQQFLPGFRLPAPVDALAFAFEVEPEWCFHANGRMLPFGCHAWQKYQPEFWSQYIPQPAR